MLGLFGAALTSPRLNWVDPGSFWGHSVIILALLCHHMGPSWCRFDPILGPFWGPFSPFLDPFRAFCPFLGRFYGHFAGLFFVIFCEIECNIKQNNAREGKRMQNCANIQQNYAKLCRNMHLFSAINDVVAVSVLPGLWTISARPPTFRDRLF